MTRNMCLESKVWCIAAKAIPSMVFEAAACEALIEACARAHSSLVEHILQNRANVNGKLENGWTALMTACRGGRLQVAELLLNHGATVDEGAPHLNALAIACLHGHTPIVQLLIEHGARQLRLDKGKDALHAASQMGHAAVLQLLLDAGGDPNRPADDGATPLLVACYGGHVRVVEMLLDQGVAIDQAATNGRTALMLAARYGHTQLVARLLHRGASVNQLQSGGGTALIFAAQGGNGLVVRLLLEAGAAVNHAAVDGWHPLMTACFFGHLDVAKRLLQRNADPDRPALDGSTPLMLACRGRPAARGCVPLLLDCGVNSTVARGDGSTALSLAVAEAASASLTGDAEALHHWTFIAQTLRDYALHECQNKPPTQAAWAMAPLRPDRSPGLCPGLSPGQLALSPPDRPLTLADPADSPAENRENHDNAASQTRGSAASGWGQDARSRTLPATTYQGPISPGEIGPETEETDEMQMLHMRMLGIDEADSPPGADTTAAEMELADMISGHYNEFAGFLSKDLMS